MATEAEGVRGAQKPELTNRRKYVVTVRAPGAKPGPLAPPISAQVALSGDDCHW